MKVIVVGAGVIGLSTAWACLKRGHEVTIIDRGPIPNPASASFDQHRMIRPHYGPQRAYTAMVRDAFPVWEALWEDLGQSFFERTGVLAVDLGDSAWMDATAEALVAGKIAHRRLSGDDLSDMAPMLELGHRAWGLLAPKAGVLLADRIVTSLAAWIARAGGDLMPMSPVIELDEENASVTLEGDAQLRADRLVVAAGAWTPGLVSDLATRLSTVQSTVAYVDPPDDQAATWATSPALFLMTDRSHLYALPPVAGTELKFGGAPVLKQAGRKRAFRIEDADLYRTLASFRPFLKGAGEYRVRRGAGGLYADPADKRFVVVERGRSFVITGCGGRMFKFGALFGQVAAGWVDGTVSGSKAAYWAAGK